MGCAYIARNVEINKKEVELDQTKAIQQESSTNLKTLSKQATEEFFEIKQCKINNLKVQKKKLDKEISRSIGSNYSNIPTYSGPIITLLRNRVDNYHRKLKK